MSENKIQCMECNKYFHIISKAHLKNCCNLTTKQYMEKYTDALLISEYYRNKTSQSAKETYRNGRIHAKGMLGKNHKLESCKKISISGKKSYENGRINPMQDKNHKLESIQKMKENHRGMNGKKHSEESKQKNRITRLNNIEKKHGIAHPNFNLDACEFFDWFNNEFNLNGFHALNGREYHIKELGYFLDYYEPNLNLIIEWNEKRHYDSNNDLKEKDQIRENEIIDHFNDVIFIRIEPHIFDNDIDEIKKNFIDLFYDGYIYQC